jgi:dCTP deaminase
MILSDITIQEYIRSGIIKFDPGDQTPIDQILDHVVCASMDLRLGNKFKIYPQDSHGVLNPFDINGYTPIQEVQVEDGQDFVLQPGDFVLWATKEQFGLPAHIVTRVEGRSSLARLGVMIHITWWFIDPGFGRDQLSTITLEIKNVNHVAVILRPNMRVCQMAFHLMDRPAQTPYNLKKSAKYNGQIDPETSRIYISG